MRNLTETIFRNNSIKREKKRRMKLKDRKKKKWNKERKLRRSSLKEPKLASL